MKTSLAIVAITIQSPSGWISFIYVCTLYTQSNISNSELSWGKGGKCVILHLVLDLIDFSHWFDPDSLTFFLFKKFLSLPFPSLGII